MKRLLILSTVVAAAFSAAMARPSSAAELEIMEPKDRAILKGAVEFKIKPVHLEGEEFFENPEVRIQTPDGVTMHQFTAVLNPQTGICAGTLDTKKLPDGIYLAEISYRTLKGDQAEDAGWDMVVAVRNGAARPAKFTLEVEDKTHEVGEQCDLIIKVLDAKGKPMPGARVSITTQGGRLDGPAEITDRGGEAFFILDSDEAGQVSVTVTVEHLAPVTRVIRFGK
jgi:hypothetical protein